MPTIVTLIENISVTIVIPAADISLYAKTAPAADISLYAKLAQAARFITSH